MEVKFRIAQKEDVKEIIDLCNVAFVEDTPIEYAMEVFEETKDDPNNIYLVGIADDKIVAHAKISIIRTMYEKMNTYAILNHVCVMEEYRRHGIATKMLVEIEKICKERGCKTMELWSNNVRIPAHSCYKKYGFHLDDAGFFSKEVRG
ncbi:MAG: GNAT family N-acetyltransferase [Bacilli bacterium]|nr:GNAT family N-acetyltransferase [Bacilli bacterium]